MESSHKKSVFYGWVLKLLGDKDFRKYNDCYEYQLFLRLMKRCIEVSIAILKPKVTLSLNSIKILVLNEP